MADYAIIIHHHIHHHSFKVLTSKNNRLNINMFFFLNLISHGLGENRQQSSAIVWISIFYNIKYGTGLLWGMSPAQKLIPLII